MHELLDLDRYPLDRADSADYERLVLDCRRQMESQGMFNLDGFVRPSAIERAVAELEPLTGPCSFTHQRQHNVYFESAVPGLPERHAALATVDSVHHTLCDDQIRHTVIHTIYEFEALPAFLAAVLQRPKLYRMDDPLGRVNVMEYRPGETLNWHFDRSGFTVTLLIQAPERGGEFEYRHALRSDSDPNYGGVAQVLGALDPEVRVNPLAPGTLNVFAGKNTLHRVAKIRGTRNRLVAVYCYYEQPGVRFSPAERIGFYGRAD
jgi:hypothetical protein